MCKHKSAWLAPNGDLFHSDVTDSHEALAEVFGIKDTSVHQELRAIRLEFTWPNDVEDITDLSKWLLKVDEVFKPEWATDEVLARAREQLEEIVKRSFIQDSRGTVLGGAWIIAKQGKARRFVRSRIVYAVGADLTRADLTRANLYGANLTGANLYGADLTGAYLSGANLSRANLSRAFLSGANLLGANLSGANLLGAFLYRADLSGAELSGVNLSRANLSRAFLSGANLSRANLSRANLSDANLSDANLSDANLSGAISDRSLPGWVLQDGHLSKDVTK